MANQLYGYNPSYGGPGAKLHPSHSPATTAAVDAYYPEPARLSSRYLSSSDRLTSDPSTHAMAERVPSLYLNKSDNLWRSSVDTVGNGIGASGEYFTAGATPSQAAWSVSASLDPVAAAAAAALKRPTEALYHQSLLGSHNTIGQSDGWFSSNYLVKRPRFESASSLPIYPQRPGEKDCAHYMHTRTCKFGDSCKFDHPIWVPEGGIPDWKEVSIVSPSESLPERPGEPDCPYFVKTQKCKFGSRCKFNHPKDILAAAENIDVSYLPERPSEPPCAFYTKTGKCKFGASCKFNHPKDIQIPMENSGGEWTASLMTNGAAGDLNLATAVPVSPAVMHNSKGLPVRLGEVDCPFYMKMGSCKYGATCRYNHPDRYGQTVLTSPASNMNIGVGSLVQTTDPRLIGLGPTIYPQRPGQIECDYYMKTGECKYGERCRFHHPIDRSAPTPSMKQAAEHVKLTLAGLPRREGALKCPFYMKTGTCSYGAMCKFDHPPPGEVMAMGSEEQ